MIAVGRILLNHDELLPAALGLFNLVFPEVVLASAIVAPLLTTVFLTVLHLAVNEVLGVHRWTAMLAYPTVFVPLIVHALARRNKEGLSNSWPKFDYKIV